MSNPITIEDIYKLFEQTNEQLQRSREEFDRRQVEGDRFAAERAAEADRRAAEADRRAAEIDRGLERLERTVAQTSREVANLTSRWGRFVEELVRPAVIRLFRSRGIDISQTSLRVKSDKVKMEIDILAVNGNSAVAVECKSRLSQDDVDDMCDRLRKFKSGFPQYANYQIYGAVAGIEINEGVDAYAYRKGLYVIRTSGDTVEIANDDKFRAVAW